MKETDRLISGFRTFQKDYFDPETAKFELLKHGQKPRTMLIGCADSRVDPALLTGSAPGDLFTARNVANLVPPYEENMGYHGVSASLEFAVCVLQVMHIIVLGHSQCGGVKALLDGGGGCAEGKFISRWMSIAEPARKKVLAENPDTDIEVKRRALEHESIIHSLENLLTFPFVMERFEAGELSLHGWYFDMAIGELLEYDDDVDKFVIISRDK